MRKVLKGVIGENFLKSFPLTRPHASPRVLARALFYNIPLAPRGEGKLSKSYTVTALFAVFLHRYGTYQVFSLSLRLWRMGYTMANTIPAIRMGPATAMQMMGAKGPLYSRTLVPQTLHFTL